MRLGALSTMAEASKLGSRSARWLAVGACSCAAALLALAGSAHAYTASLTRTTGGVANIEAATLGDAGFASGYGQAEDGICTLADVYLTVSGERSRFLGPHATVTDEASGVTQRNLASDFYWTAMDASGTIEALLAEPYPQGPSAAAKELVAGFAAGYDAYLAAVGGPAGVTDPRCAGAAWVRPITSIDVWRRVYELATIEGGSPRAELIADAEPPDPPGGGAGGAARPRHASTAAKIAAVKRTVAKAAPKLDAQAAKLDGNFHAPGAGSNGLGIGAEDSSDGNGLVLANPHFPWIGDERFWESHVDVPGVYDTIGASLWGSPLPLIGHNQHVAWTHTVSTNVTTTTWALMLREGHPTEYEVDGKAIPMTQRTVSVQALEHGVLTPYSHTFYYTTYGPVIGGLYPWTTEHAFAFDDANGNNLRVIDQWLQIGEAQSAEGVIAAEKAIEGVPWVNTIGADDKGKAFYSEIAVTPYLPKTYLESSCNLSPSHSPAGPFVGFASACELGSDLGAVVPQIFSGDSSPAAVREDYVENSNNSFWLANEQEPLEGYSPAFGAESVNPGMRSQTGIDMVNQRMGTLNGGVPTDGLSSTPGFTVQTLKESWTKFRSLPAERALPYVAALCEALVAGPYKGVLGGVDISEACPILKAYEANESARLDSPGGWLFAEWWNHAPVGNSEFWAYPWKAADPVYTPNTVNLTPGAKVTEEDATALVEAVSILRMRKIPLAASFGEVQFAPQRKSRIPLPGCDERDDCFAIVDSNYDSPASSTTTADFGSSIVMFSEMNPVSGPVTQGLLTYSQSEDLTSPFYEDQTLDFSENKWITLPWTPAQVSADALGPPQTLTDAAVKGSPPPGGQTQQNAPETGVVTPPGAAPEGKHGKGHLTRAQKLKRALRQCNKKSSQHKRKACRANARRKYGPRLTQAQKLKRALKRCTKAKSQHKRALCRKRAHKRFAVKRHHGKRRQSTKAVSR